ncbi:MAG: hypothetical protein ABW185_30010 [Sedimenticola sp.]
MAWLGLLIVVDNSGVRVTKLLATFKPAIPVKFTRPGESKEVAKEKAQRIDLLSVSLGRCQSITSPRTQPNLNPYWCLLNQSSLWVSIYKGLYMLSVPWQRFVRHPEFFQHLRIASQKIINTGISYFFTPWHWLLPPYFVGDMANIEHQ